MAVAPHRKKTKESSTVPRLPGKRLLVVFALVIIVAVVWYALAATNGSTSSPGKHTKSAAITAKAKPLHSSNEALESVTMFYNAYLPLKAQVVAAVGDNQYVEPAAVKVVRASEDYFTPKFYDSILADYMAEYQSTGKVTKDDVACVNNTTTTTTVALASTSKDSAVVNVTITLTNNTTKVVPVTINLHTLKVSKIDCSA